MRPSRSFLLGTLLLAGLLLVAGCGYRLAGQGTSLPGGVKSLYIASFANKTAEPFLDTAISNALSRRFNRSRNLRVVAEENQAEAVLSGAVVGYSSRPLSYDRQDRVREYRSKMKVEGRLTSVSDGRILWQGSVGWQEDYAASDNLALQEDRERAAVEVLVERLADELYYRLMDDF
ncbi:outer membrane lipopolysaccharide assembly protein LptE/RlpB [Geothermobacter ehrlichii]|uniref:Outer membrane lipopolysaccharide assembly protein LptE/RlpB n=1 Tax=Geothermobacter ehrlichii TaxID=213224 RepID=A0A5D3WNJ8_9BACT|nr:LptE family protein [Geothermobacter ehrlichii]TYP00142.1 outer membrane lipopolysaccharide assembly protein LptE/RlpB [Geothermobacter ehrlichii]